MKYYFLYVCHSFFCLLVCFLVFWFFFFFFFKGSKDIVTVINDIVKHACGGMSPSERIELIAASTSLMGTILEKLVPKKKDFSLEVCVSIYTLYLFFS